MIHTDSPPHSNTILMYPACVSRTQPPSSFNKRVGENIRLLRLSHGLSQAQLAAILQGSGFGLHQQGVAKIEQGERPLRFEEALAISAILEVDPAVLTQLDQSEERDAAMKKLFRAEDNVGRVQRQVNDLRFELEIAIKSLQDAQISETDARQKLALLGGVEIDGMWQFPEGTDG
jgi:transcriptional regulator with XRE-family HTH domain